MTVLGLLLKVDFHVFHFCLIGCSLQRLVVCEASKSSLPNNKFFKLHW